MKSIKATEAGENAIFPQVIGSKNTLDPKEISDFFSMTDADKRNHIIAMEEKAMKEAAAEDMYEALKSASNQLTSDGHVPTLVALLDAAIAKAEGK